MMLSFDEIIVFKAGVGYVFLCVPNKTSRKYGNSGVLLGGSVRSPRALKIYLVWR